MGGGCVQHINLANLLPDSESRAPLCETEVLDGEAAFSKALDNVAVGQTFLLLFYHFGCFKIQ